MSKKVLILSSSARKGGNSDLICDQFMLGALESGNLVERSFWEIKNQLLNRLLCLQHK